MTPKHLRLGYTQCTRTLTRFVGALQRIGLMISGLRCQMDLNGIVTTWRLSLKFTTLLTALIMCANLQAQTSEARKSAGVSGATQGTGILNLTQGEFTWADEKGTIATCKSQVTNGNIRILSFSNCALEEGRTLDELITQLIKAEQYEEDGIDKCNDRFRKHLDDDLKMLKEFQQILRPVPIPKDNVKKG